MSATSTPLPQISAAAATLIIQGKLQDSDLQRARIVALESNAALNPLLVKLGLVSGKDLAAVLAELHGIPALQNSDIPEAPIALPGMSPNFLRAAGVLPLGHEPGTFCCAMMDPEDSFTRRALELATECKLEVKIGMVSQLHEVLGRIYGIGETKGDVPGQGEEAPSASHSVESIDRLRDLASEAPIVRLVNLLINRAVAVRASDIHIEPYENRLDVRYRIDGVLQDVESPPAQSSAAILSRIKLMAKLNIAERRLPQDGRIQIQSHGKSIDLRVSTVPTLHGESLVLRLLDKEQVALDFTSLGFSPPLQAQMTKLLELPHGILLATGPTGSGKTTTLYTALKRLNTRERKILTVEDPIEYQLPGINQIQVKPQINLTFANALRSIVRQDPDVIMIGEMRDLETASIAVQSALTGHLVLSTLHTNDAGSSVTRLLDMGIEDYLLTTTLVGVLAQRLVRVLCVHCRQPYEPEAALVQELKLRTYAAQEPICLFRAQGCDHCSHTGYRGRQVIVELLVMTDPIRRAILARADGTEIQRIAIEQGMKTMKADGLRKALAGITTVEEVTRVTQG